MSITVEKIFTRPDKSRVMLRMDFWSDTRKFECRLDVRVCAPGKRKFSFYKASEIDSYQFRNLTMSERRKKEIEYYHEILSHDEIKSAIKEAWDKLLPDYTI